MIRAVLFDFGGVLVRFRDRSGHRQWERRLGLPEGGLAALVFDSEISRRAALGLVPEIAIWQNIGVRFGLHDRSIRQLEQDFWRGEYLDERLIDLLRGLRPSYKTGILSNASSDARATFTHRFGLDREVDLMIISAEEGVAKPDARIYHLAAERLGAPPERILFVDDLAENIAAARQVGMVGIQFQNADQVIRDVRRALDGAAE